MYSKIPSNGGTAREVFNTRENFQFEDSPKDLCKNQIICHNIEQ